MNPYAPPPTTSVRKCSLAFQHFTFAAAATVAFILATLISHWLRSDARPIAGPSIQFATSFLPVFAFSAFVANLNLHPVNASGYIRSTWVTRLVGGLTLGFVPVPFDHFITDYLWFMSPGFPHKVAEIALVVLVPVFVCTVVERSILKFVTYNAFPARTPDVSISDCG